MHARIIHCAAVSVMRCMSPMSFATFAVTSASSRSPGFAGHAIPADLRALAREFDLGGVILFARNVDAPEQVAELAREAQALAQRAAAVGQRRSGRRPRRAAEGAVHRVAADDDARAERRRARWRSGSRARWPPSCKAVGISLDYTPVLDIHTNPKNPVIGDRALAERAEDVARLGRGDHRDAAGRGHRGVRQALSRARRHQHRLAPRAAAHRASARSARRRRARAVPGGDRGGRRVDHDGAHPDPGARRGASGDAVAGDRRRPAEEEARVTAGSS